MIAKYVIQGQAQAQCEAVVGVQPVSVSLLIFFSGIIFVQFGVFCIARADRVPRTVIISAVTITMIHIGQVFLEFWTLHQSTNQCISGEAYSFSLYESFQTFFTLSVTWAVQCHFSRLIGKLMGRPKWWICLAGSLCLSSLVGGIASSLQFMMLNPDNKAKKLAPLKLGSCLTGFYTLWLISNAVYDIIISWMLSTEVLRHRAEMKTDSIRSTLFRLMMLTLRTFTLSSILGLMSAAAIIALQFTPTTAFQSLNRLHTLVFVSNGFMNRIYLISFFSSIVPKPPTLYSDSCVASLNIINNSKENMINNINHDIHSNSNHEERTTSQAMTYTVDIRTTED
ncbi:uncharacterized protein MELLADRAFT_74531 [Melampsora larici-populina 98AG31]|uniref:Uncharacterized protein n=1 Tax=Melampsora larici-populina (strain 98AG31 / pathotype 3-4-7) TaxID=747676 RepID=F4RGP1_MELLP|nr:uncharacterized protein MELLADRAFT_74531 [Melampsora larici-populina 98AG31]EGG08592.1 hypothetical protein MELLADRAFT_74531 [Melampsora larici-populina 98AG31]